ncbi:MAG: hypothetical protein IJP98_01240 [Clostridia bacterium]|nr:hypothetical protein [Clostridia bacterium]
MQEFKEMLQKNKWAILLVVATVVSVIVIACLRWWAFLVLPLLAAAVLFGHLLDKGGTAEVRSFFERLFGKRN